MTHKELLQEFTQNECISIEKAIETGRKIQLKFHCKDWIDYHDSAIGRYILKNREYLWRFKY